MIEATLREYHNLGFRPFPLIPNDKRPLRTGWQLTTLEDVISDISITSNFGLVMGGIFFAFDVDNLESYEKLIKDYEPLPITATQRTQSGKLHFIFKKPPDKIIGNRTCFITGLDIRGDGGYIVAAPSIINGKPYEWINHPREGIADAPEWFIDLITTKEEKERKSKGVAGRVRNIKPTKHRFFRDGNYDELLQEMIERFPIPSRDTRFPIEKKVIGSLGHREFKTELISRVVKGWWTHYYERGVVNHHPNESPSPQRIPGFFSEDFRQRITPEQHQENLSSLVVEEHLLRNLLSNKTTTKTREKKNQYKGGKKDLLALQSLIIYFYYEVQVKGIDPEWVPAVNNQFRAIAERISGNPIDEDNFKKNLAKWTTRPNKPAGKIGLIERIEEGTKYPTTPSIYRCTGIEDFFPSVVEQNRF